MWTQVVKIGQNRYFCGKLNNFFLRPAEELIFSLKHSYLNVLTGKTTPALEKNYTLRKMTSKWPKIDFSDMDFWLLSENRIFRPWRLKITITKSKLTKTTLNNGCNRVLILFLWRLWWTQLIIEIWTKITPFFVRLFLHGYYDGNG